MELTKKERLSLINQYRILEQLDAKSADHYHRLITILKNGYELHYSDLDNFIAEPMSEEQCREVLDVLSMFEALQDAYKKLKGKDKDGIDKNRIVFAGYDGNNESELMGYVAYLVEQDNRFTHIVKRGKYNSHLPAAARYREMLERFRPIRAQNELDYLTREQIIEIIS